MRHQYGHQQHQALIMDGQCRGIAGIAGIGAWIEAAESASTRSSAAEPVYRF